MKDWSRPYAWFEKAAAQDAMVDGMPEGYLKEAARKVALMHEEVGMGGVDGAIDAIHWEDGNQWL